MNEITYKIHGIERRKVKHELSGLKSFVKTFWYYHQLDKDMTSFYGGSETYPMSDELATQKFNETNEKIKLLEEKLSILYNE